MTTEAAPAPSTPGFRHEALFYAGLDEFVRATAPFVAGAVDHDEPILVVVSADKIDALREALEPPAQRVRFADMCDVGHNPARIIPAWRDFVNEFGPGRRLRGIGEPISAERSDDAMVECHRHEALLNLAFAECSGFWLRCPYDTSSLAPAVVDEAKRNHPWLVHDGVDHESGVARDLTAIAAAFDEPLPAPPGPVEEVIFDGGTLGAVRSLVRARATAAHLSEPRTADLVLAVNEIATNSIRHGGGGGVARTWMANDVVVCEIRDRGEIHEPLVGRRRPTGFDRGGRGVWVANQVCDLVQVRSSPTGTVVRLHLRAG